MKLLNKYVFLVEKLLVKLNYICMKNNGKKYYNLSRKIDKNILESYIFIEKIIDEELDDN